MGLSDDDLIIACLRGDRVSAHTLASKYLRVCYSIALSFLNNTEDAEDAAQNAMIAALSSLHQLSSVEKFKPWLYQIVRNASKAHITKASKQRTLNIDEVPDVPSESNHAHISIQRNNLIKAMEKLSKNEKQVLLLYDLDGFNHKEIAEFTGFSEENSRQLLFFGKKKNEEGNCFMKNLDLTPIDIASDKNRYDSLVKNVVEKALKRASFVGQMAAKLVPVTVVGFSLMIISLFLLVNSTTPDKSVKTPDQSNQALKYILKIDEGKPDAWKTLQNLRSEPWID